MTSRQENIRSPDAVQEPQRARGSASRTRPAARPRPGGVALDAGDAGAPRLLAQPGGGPRPEALGAPGSSSSPPARSVAAAGVAAQGQRRVAERQHAALADPEPVGPGGEVPAQPALLVGEEGPRLRQRHAGRQGQRRGRARSPPPAAPCGGRGRCGEGATSIAGSPMRMASAMRGRPSAPALGPDEVADLGQDHAAPARAVEDAVVADALRHEVPAPVVGRGAPCRAPPRSGRGR